MKIQDAVEGFIQYLKVRRYSARTVKQMERHLDRFERYLMRTEKHHIDIERLTVSDLDDYRRYLAEYRDVATGQALKEQTRTNLFLSVRRFFRFLVEQELLSQSPAEKIEIGKAVETAPKGLMTRDEVRRILEQPDIRTPLGIRDRTMLEVLYGCGLRSEEFVSLNVADVDLEKGFVLVRCGKGAKDRVVPIADVTAEWVAKYLEGVRPTLSHSGNETPAIWLTSQGKRVQWGTLAQVIHKYKAAAGVEKEGTAHAFRHSIATHLLDAGMDLRYIQEFLGHEHIQSTERYTTVAVAGLAAMLEEKHPRTRMKIAAPKWVPKETGTDSEGGHVAPEVPSEDATP